MRSIVVRVACSVEPIGISRMPPEDQVVEAVVEAIEEALAHQEHHGFNHRFSDDLTLVVQDVEAVPEEDE